MTDNAGMEKDTSTFPTLWRVTAKDRYAVMREEYLGGLTARRVCERHGVKEATFRSHLHKAGISKKKAAEAGWAAQKSVLDPAAALAPPGMSSDGQTLTAPSPDDQPMDPREATRQALVHAARLLAQGKLGEAVEVAKLAETMSRAVDRLGLGEAQAPEVDEEATWAEVRARVIALAAED